MNKIINFQDYKKSEEDKKESTEIFAFENYGIIKLEDDVYLAPKFRFSSGSAELKIYINQELDGSISEFLEPEVIFAVNNIVTNPNENITILESKKPNSNMKVFEICNLDNDEQFIISTEMEGSDECRQMFTAIIAGAIRQKHVNVTFFIKVNYEELKDFL